MKAFAALLLAGAAAFAQQPTPEAPPARLLEVKTVYLLKMARGLDQYLSNHIHRNGTFVVVTDPARADAVLTDRVGRSLEDELARLYPKPTESAEPEADEDKDRRAVEASRQGPESTWGRGRGTVFLVDVASRHLLWSTYHPSATSQSTEVDRAAREIAISLKRDLEKLRKPSK